MILLEPWCQPWWSSTGGPALAVQRWWPSPGGPALVAQPWWSSPGGPALAVQAWWSRPGGTVLVAQAWWPTSLTNSGSIHQGQRQRHSGLYNNNPEPQPHNPKQLTLILNPSPPKH